MWLMSHTTMLPSLVEVAMKSSLQVVLMQAIWKQMDRSVTNVLALWMLNLEMEKKLQVVLMQAIRKQMDRSVTNVLALWMLNLEMEKKLQVILMQAIWKHGQIYYQHLSSLNGEFRDGKKVASHASNLRSMDRSVTNILALWMLNLEMGFFFNFIQGKKS